MKARGLLLEPRTGAGRERRHDGRVAVDRPDTRWCSDGFEIGCENGERVRIAFTWTAVIAKRSRGWRPRAASRVATSAT